MREELADMCPKRVSGMPFAPTAEREIAVFAWENTRRTVSAALMVCRTVFVPTDAGPAVWVKLWKVTAIYAPWPG
jgi:hypothetical protein